MEDLDEVVQEIDSLPDDLYLDDVGGDRPGKKYSNWIALRNRKNIGARGRGRSVKRSGFERKVDKTEDDLFDLDEHDLNALENWDLDEDELEALELEGELSKKAAFRNRNLRGRGVTNKRGLFKRGGIQRQFRPERYEGVKPSEDIFDIEGKSHRQRFVWNREDAFSNDERLKHGAEKVERDEHTSPGYLVHRKDPRNLNRQISDIAENRFGPSRNDPRLKQTDTPGSEMMDNIYAPARKDPRLVPQQALVPRQNVRPRSDPRLKQFEARFGMRKDSKFSLDNIANMQSQNLDIGPPGVEEIMEAAPSNEQLKIRRGPRSPSPSPPPRMSRERSFSISPGRKHEHSPSSWRSRSHRERSPSPRRRSSMRRDSLSPRRRDWRSSSRDRGSPSRRLRRERSISPRSRRRHSRERSVSPRRDHSRDRSLSDRRDRSLSPRRHSSFSPPRHSSLSSSRDEPWRKSPGRMPPPPHFAQMQPTQQQSYEVLGPPQNMYSEGNYSGSAPSGPSYGAPPPSTSAQPQPPPPPPPPGYSNYQQYAYDNYYQQPPPPPNTYSGEYAPPSMPPGSWSDGGMVYPDVSQPPPVQIPGASGNQASGTGSLGAPVNQKSEEAKKEAVKNELIQQKQTLSKQREEYVRKKTLIARELELLKEQEEELLEEHSRDNERILKENHKLQLEIQNKLKAINNVIDMLTGIIGDKDQLDDKRKASHKDSEKKKPKTPPETPPQSSDSEHGGKVEDENSKHLSKDRPAYNYVHYDPEMHWCRVCDVFPRTAKEYLNHLHSTEHKEETLERKLVDMPWHKNMPDQEVPHIPGAPTKRTPIRGLQFFISATAWYCKMCDVWIGDLHCASLHLKSKQHSENYAKFTEQNPHWETDWLADRERAYERCSEERRRMKDEKDPLPSGIEQASSSSKQFIAYSRNIKTEVKEEKSDLKKKRNKEQRKKVKKNCLTALDEVKKKKRHKKKQKSKKSHGSPHSSYSSSSSSDSGSSSSSSDEGGNLENEDKTKSIRVTMRNKIKGVQEQVQLHQVPLLPRSRWDSPPEEKPEEEKSGKPEWIREKHEPKLKQSSGDDKLIREWMSTSKEVSDGEKQLLNSIKDRLRQKQEADREKEREKRDDRRDSRRGKRQSESPSSPSYRSKRSRSDKSPEERRDRPSKFDRYDRHETIHRSPERSRRDSNFKSDQKSKDEPEVKVPDRKSELEKKILAKFDEEEEEDEESAESKFEKQTAESAAKLMKKAKKPAVMAIPKSKLPFIGRMPILKHFAKKKKPEETKLENEDKKQLPEDPLVEAQYKLEFTNVGGKVHIGPQETATIGPELPPAEQVQDMEIDEDTSNSDVEPPVIETSVTVETETSGQSPGPKKPVTDIPLPKDFQDALNILFPGQESTEKKEESDDNPPGVIQSGPKPPSNHQQGHWPPGHPQMSGPPMMPPMQGYGGSPQMMGGGSVGPPMMGHMHGMQGPHPPSHMQGPQGMYGPPYGMPVPPGPMMSPQNVPHPANMIRKSEPPLRHPPPLPPKENKPSIKLVTSKKETSAKKSDAVGGMSADELAMMGIDVGDMAAQSF